MCVVSAEIETSVPHRPSALSDGRGARSEGQLEVTGSGGKGPGA